jgi:hypothetical protein
MLQTHSASSQVVGSAKSLLTAAVVAGLLVQPRLVLAQDANAGSAVTTKELVTTMNTQKLTAFAAQDPAVPTRFVAAMLFPETQLLIVSAVSTSPDYINAQIAQKQYAEVYASLNASAAPATKLFFQDMGCDGLSRDGEQVDVMYDERGQQVLFDGQGKISRLSKTEYAAKFATAETQYAAMVAVLLKGLRVATSSGAQPLVVNSPVRNQSPMR